ncbi:zinc ABC transporter substrate-binding protein [Lachnospiraceae bacterium MD335]|nr:zinc ABC transporter substrate-binding protein [Lachnospiraceae bacterium MD335]
MQKNRSWLWRLSLLLCVMLCAAGMTGCSSTNGTDTAKYSIVCTTFPQYDWLREIIGENADSFSLMLLLDKGGDLHSYQPTAESIARISSADMFVYVGGESDTWVEDALKGAVNKDMRVVNLMDLLGGMVKEEELVEGMQCYEEAEHEETEYDEHVWLSLKNAAYLTGALSETLQELDAEHAQEYAANAAAYIESLNALDREYADAVKQSEKKTILFGDRFPFRYLTEDYGINYYAAFAGCSTETDASFETVTFLSGKVDELGLHTILTIEGSDQKIAEIIRENTHGKNQQIQIVNSLQSVTAKEIQDGFTYLKAMRENYEVLKNALN